MDSFVKAVEKFLTRDLLYILGGGSLIFSILYYFNIALPEKLESYQIIFGAGIAYVLGYIIQEIISLTPILTTSHFKPNRFVRWLYKRFSNNDLSKDLNMTNLEAFFTIYPSLSDRQIEQIERTITLKHVGSTMGANWLVSSLFTLLKALESYSSFDIFMAIGLLLLSLFLIFLSWIKGAQQMQIFYELDEAKKNNNT